MEPVSGAVSEPAALSLKVAKTATPPSVPTSTVVAIRDDGKLVKDGVIALNETSSRNFAAKIDQVRQVRILRLGPLHKPSHIIRNKTSGE